MAKNKEEKVVQLQFVCPDCGGRELLFCESVERVLEVTSIPSNGNIEFNYDGQLDNGDAEPLYFECKNCGKMIRKDGSNVLDADYVTDFDELVNWIKLHCKENTPKLEDIKVIKLDTGGIIVTLVGWDGKKAKTGTIVSKLHEVCSHCGDPKCRSDCPQSDKWEKKHGKTAEIRQQMHEERSNFREANFAVDTLESTILAHAIAGVDIESESYINGIDTAIDAIVNHS